MKVEYRQTTKEGQTNFPYPEWIFNYCNSRLIETI